MLDNDQLNARTHETHPTSTTSPFSSSSSVAVWNRTNCNAIDIAPESVEWWWSSGRPQHKRLASRQTGTDCEEIMWWVLQCINKRHKHKTLHHASQPVASRSPRAYIYTYIYSSTSTSANQRRRGAFACTSNDNDNMPSGYRQNGISHQSSNGHLSEYDLLYDMPSFSNVVVYFPHSIHNIYIK